MVHHLEMALEQLAHRLVRDHVLVLKQRDDNCEGGADGSQGLWVRFR